jgi:hypothetical protein
LSRSFSRTSVPSLPVVPRPALGRDDMLRGDKWLFQTTIHVMRQYVWEKTPAASLGAHMQEEREKRSWLRGHSRPGRTNRTTLEVEPATGISTAGGFDKSRNSYEGERTGFPVSSVPHTCLCSIFPCPRPTTPCPIYTCHCLRKPQYPVELKPLPSSSPLSCSFSFV